MGDFRLTERRTSSDPRDVGSWQEKVLGRHPDGERLRRVAEAMTGIARNAREAFMAGPCDRSFEDRHASVDAYEARIAKFFPVSLRGDIVSFHVEEQPEQPLVDLDAVYAEFVG